jgi:hypothetical protein
LQKKVPESAGTLPTTSPLFASMLGGTVLLVAAIVFIPALASVRSQRPCHDRRTHSRTQSADV